MRSFGLAGATVISPSGEAIVGLRQQPAGEHGLGERHRDRVPSGGAEHAEAFGQARAGAAEFLRHP